MANTWWVSTLGNDATNDGTAYGAGPGVGAKRTLGGVFALGGLAKGDTINVVNDGDHTWPLQASENVVKAGIKGSNLTTDFSLIIRGTNAAGNNEKTRVVPLVSDGNGFRSWFRVNADMGYIIVRGFSFDSSALPADTNAHNVCRLNDNGTPDPGLVNFDGCELIGAALGTQPGGNRDWMDIVTTAPPAGTELCYITNCYMQNPRGPQISGMGATHLKRITGTLIYYDQSTGSIGSLMQQTLSGVLPGGEIHFRNNTVILIANISLSAALVDYTLNIGVPPAGVVNVHSNLVYWESNHASPNLRFFTDGVAKTSAQSLAIPYTGTVGYNVLIGGPNISAGDVNANGYYTNRWDANQDDAASPDVYPSDVVQYGKQLAEVFAHPLSTYLWDPLNNGVQFTIPKDFRPIAPYLTLGLDGTVPGALPAYYPPAEPWVNEIPEVPMQETWEFLTSVVTSDNGINEQRMALRMQPRKNIQVDYIIGDPDRRRDAYRQLYGAANGKIRIPFFPYATNLTQNAAVSATKLFFDPTKTDLRTGETVVLYRRSDNSFYQLELGTVVSDGATLQLPLTQQFFTTDVIMPSEVIISQDRASINMDIVSGTLSVQGVIGQARTQFPRPGSATAFTSFDSLTVLEKRPNAGADEGFLRDLDIFDNDTGIVDSETHWAHPFLDGRRAFWIPRIKTPAEMDFWRDFMYAVRGMREPFLLPTWFADMVLNVTPANNATTIDVITSDYSSKYFPYDTYKRLRFEAPDGSIIYRKVSSVLVLTPTTQRLTIPALPGTASWGSGFVISFLNKVRLGSDQIKLTHYGVTTIIEFLVRTTDT